MRRRSDGEYKVVENKVRSFLVVSRTLGLSSRACLIFVSVVTLAFGVPGMAMLLPIFEVLQVSFVGPAVSGAGCALYIFCPAMRAGASTQRAVSVLGEPV
jgi:hypothetical protein